MRTHLLAISLTAALSLAACGADAPTSAPASSASLTTLTLKPEPAARERTWDGVVQAVNRATLAAQTAGRVVELPFDVNDYVKAGDVVVRFTDVEQRSGRAQADAALKAAQAQSAEAQADQQRIAGLAERQLVSRQQLDQATARRDSARANLAAAQAGVRQAGEQVDYTVVRAPYSGLITERFVQIGETVRPGQPLIAGLSLAQLRVEVQVPQADIAAIREHKTAVVRLADGRDVPAEKLIVFPYADANTHTFTVRLELPEVETGLQPGNSAKVRFKLGEAERLLVPATALVRRSEVQGVYVVTAEGSVVLRQIRLGHAFADRVEVLAGLSAGDVVALDPVAAFAAQRKAKESASE